MRTTEPGDIPKTFPHRWLKGDLVSELASDFWVSQATIRYWVWKLRLPKRPMGRNTRLFRVGYMMRQLEAKKQKCDG